MRRMPVGFTLGFNGGERKELTEKGLERLREARVMMEDLSDEFYAHMSDDLKMLDDFNNGNITLDEFKAYMESSFRRAGY